jgi:hypothetical protein
MIKLITEEFLDEMATIYKNKEYGVLVAVNPDSRRIGIPYFKFYNNSNYNKADSVIRILFTEPDYIVHKDGKKLWNLNSSDKRLLMQILQEESKQYKGITNWDAAKFNWNYEYLEEMLDFEKYFDGEYDKQYKDVVGYIKSDLEIPDYTQIEI